VLQCVAVCCSVSHNTSYEHTTCPSLCRRALASRAPQWPLQKSREPRQGHCTFSCALWRTHFLSLSVTKVCAACHYTFSRATRLSRAFLLWVPCRLTGFVNASKCSQVCRVECRRCSFTGNDVCCSVLQCVEVCCSRCSFTGNDVCHVPQTKSLSSFSKTTRLIESDLCHCTFSKEGSREGAGALPQLHTQ